MWEPPRDVLEAGERLRGRVPHVRGSLTSATDPVVQKPIAPGTALLARWLKDRWQLTQAGTRRAASMSSPAQRADGTWRRRDIHEDGRAIDAMTGRDKRKGHEIGNLLVKHADLFGVQYLVFDDLEWASTSVGDAWEPQATSLDRRAWGRTPNAHGDHVHVELSPAWAESAERMQAAIDGAERGTLGSSPTLWPWALAGVVLLGAGSWLVWRSR